MMQPHGVWLSPRTGWRHWACRRRATSSTGPPLAFAVQVLAVLNAWDWSDDAKLNVSGSGISLGHPIGATGMRILTTMLHQLRRSTRWSRPGDHVYRWRPR